MLEINELYGVEVIVHIDKQATDQVINGLIQPKQLPDWIEATVIQTGNECKKGLKMGDNVIIDKTCYQESPILPKSQFDFPLFEDGTFHIMTEYRIVMKVQASLAFDINKKTHIDRVDI